MRTTLIFRSMWPKALIALALVFVLALSSIQAGSAETAGQRSTRNIILAATAVTLGIILYNNYQHKTVAHNTIVGRTADGGIVYADGRIVYPDGTVVYTSNDGRHLCDYDGDADDCGPHARGFPWRFEDEGQWHGKHLGWNRGRGNPHHGEDEPGHDHG